MAQNPRPRLHLAVLKMVETMAKRAGRSVPAEVNFALRAYYTAPEYKLQAIGPTGEGGPQMFSTRLNPKMRAVPMRTLPSPRTVHVRPDDKLIVKVPPSAAQPYFGKIDWMDGAKARRQNTRAKHMTEARG